MPTSPHSFMKPVHAPPKGVSPAGRPRTSGVWKCEKHVIRPDVLRLRTDRLLSGGGDKEAKGGSGIGAAASWTRECVWVNVSDWPWRQQPNSNTSSVSVLLVSQWPSGAPLLFFLLPHDQPNPHPAGSMKACEERVGSRGSLGGTPHTSPRLFMPALNEGLTQHGFSHETHQKQEMVA